MRRLRYNVAMSLDGYITDRQERFDWIPNDDSVDFAGLFARVDTYILGRRTYETVLANGEPPWQPGMRVFVISRTLEPGPQNGVTVIGEDPVALANALRHESGDGEIWLFGGGQLFATLLAANQVDSVELTIVPVLLGGGVPVVTALPARMPLTFSHSHTYPSGMCAMYYRVPGAAG
jgi:dihydrofolate reductase